MRILVSGGGTAGHVWPVLAVVEALKARHPDTEFLYVGSRGGERAIVEGAGLEFRAIRAGKFRRYGAGWWRDPEQLWANARDVVNFKLGIIQSLLIIRRWGPAVVLAKGGYVSLPVGIAAWALRVPLVIHETDLVMGLANRILSRLATRVAVPIDRGVDPKFVETGNPIRSELFSPQSYEFFTGEPELPTVLVTGVSGLWLAHGYQLWSRFGDPASWWLAAMAIVWARELGRYGVTANAIAPVARTRMTENLGGAAGADVPADKFDIFAPENISPLVVWLGSPEAKDVTGRVFSVAGGRISVNEGWRRGPTATKDDRWEPAELGSVIPDLVAKAAPNSTMAD